MTEQTSSTPRRVLIAVHGVGVPRPGEVLAELMRVPPAAVTLPVYEDSRQHVGTHVVHRLHAPGGQPFDSLVEVNWADIGRAHKGVAGTLRHLALLIMAMLRAQPGQLTANDGQGPIARLYRHFFEGYFIWCIWPPLATLLTDMASGSEKLLILSLIMASIVGLTRWLSRYSSAARTGYLWALLVVIIGAIGEWTSIDAVKLSASVYAWGQVITVALLLILGAHTLATGWRRRSRDQVMTRIALAHAPLIMMTILGGLIWRVALLIPDATTVKETWAPKFLEGIRYDLPAVEDATTVVIAVAIPILIFVGALVYMSKRRRAQRAGLSAQNWISTMLVAVPALLTAPALLLLYSFATRACFSEGCADASSVVDVYTRSALRVIPWFALAYVVFPILFDVLGDVAFFVVPTGSPLSVMRRTSERLRAILDVYRTSHITLVAYSQGCVVALATLEGNDDVDLITVGAPIQSLYRRFLGLEFGVAHTERRWRWRNVWRAGDYIAGPIESADENTLTHEDGGHLDYFCDAEVWSAFGIASFMPSADES